MSGGTDGGIEDAGSGGSTRTPLAVLLVEDNPDDALLVKEELSESFEVHHAEGFSDGVVRLSERLFDVVLLDLFLPDSDGTESVQSLRDRFPDTPIVVLTGRDDETFALSALQQGAQDYIVKGSSDAFRLGRSILYAVRRQRAQERRKREIVLEEQSRKLQSLAVLASGIAHDFNNILMGILGNIAILREQLEFSDAHLSRLREIESGALRAADMTAQLLAYAGRGEISRRELSLNEVIEEAEELVRPLLPARIRVSRHFAASVPRILGDATQIRQVVMNLILNAADAVESDTGLVSLLTGVFDLSETDLRSCHHDEAVEPGPFVFLEVSDNGCGMDAETGARMFDPFFTTKGDGHGLGLASTMGIVTRHGGAVRVSSTLSEGTSIRVYFPMMDGAASDTTSDSKNADSQLPTPTATVLVVEDDIPIRRYVVAALENEGFRAVVARDGRGALDVLGKNPSEIGAVLLDWRLPDGRGDEVLGRLREMRPDLPVIIMSGADERESELQRTTDFLQKPFAPGQLVDVLRPLLASWEDRTH